MNSRFLLVAAGFLLTLPTSAQCCFGCQNVVTASAKDITTQIFDWGQIQRNSKTGKVTATVAKKCGKILLAPSPIKLIFAVQPKTGEMVSIARDTLNPSIHLPAGRNFLPGDTIELFFANELFFAKGPQVFQTGMMVVPLGEGGGSSTGIALPFRYNKRLQLNVKNPRWGRYSIYLVHSGLASEATKFKTTVGDKESTHNLVVEKKSSAPQAQKLYDHYFSKSGSIQIQIQGIATTKKHVNVTLHAVVLIPTKESNRAVSQNVAGQILLHSKDSTVHGRMLRYEPNPKKNTLGFWANTNDYAWWNFDVKRKGRYQLNILQGCGKGHGGSEVEICVASLSNRDDVQKLKFTVKDTGHFQNFIDRNVGAVTLGPGRYRCEVRPIRKPGGAVMDLRKITLVPTTD